MVFFRKQLYVAVKHHYECSYFYVIQISFSSVGFSLALSPTVPAAPGEHREQCKRQHSGSLFPLVFPLFTSRHHQSRTSNGRASQSPRAGVCVSVKVRVPRPPSKFATSPWRTYLCLDVLPVIIREPVATLPIQLL